MVYIIYFEFLSNQDLFTLFGFLGALYYILFLPLPLYYELI